MGLSLGGGGGGGRGEQQEQGQSLLEGERVGVAGWGGWIGGC